MTCKVNRGNGLTHCSLAFFKILCISLLWYSFIIDTRKNYCCTAWGIAITASSQEYFTLWFDLYLVCITIMSISVAARSKTGVCGLSPAGIAESNSAGGMDICIFECCVLSVRCLCYRLITRPEESNHVRMSECDREASIMRRLWPTKECCAIEK
jgi:hypothetical protein